MVSGRCVGPLVPKCRSSLPPPPYRIVPKKKSRSLSPLHTIRARPPQPPRRFHSFRRLQTLYITIVLAAGPYISAALCPSPHHRGAAQGTLYPFGVSSVYLRPSPPWRRPGRSATQGALCPSGGRSVFLRLSPPRRHLGHPLPVRRLPGLLPASLTAVAPPRLFGCRRIASPVLRSQSAYPSLWTQCTATSAARSVS